LYLIVHDTLSVYGEYCGMYYSTKVCHISDFVIRYRRFTMGKHCTFHISYT